MRFLQQHRQPLQWWGIWFGLACLLVVGVSVASLVNLAPLQMKVSDKTLHFVVYCGITLWWLQLFKGRWLPIFIVVLAIALGVGLEVAQSFHPMRHMDYRDAIANAIGAGLGYCLSLAGLKNGLLWIEPYLQRLIKPSR